MSKKLNRIRKARTRESEPMYDLVAIAPWTILESLDEALEDGSINVQREQAVAIMTMLPFKVQKDDGEIGYVSVQKIADALGWSIEYVIESLKRLADDDVIRWNAETMTVEIGSIEDFLSALS